MVDVDVVAPHAWGFEDLGKLGTNHRTVPAAVKS